MSTSERAEAPIYAQLVKERGDVPADCRRAAEETWREVSRTTNFNLSRGGSAPRHHHL